MFGDYMNWFFAAIDTPKEIVQFIYNVFSVYEIRGLVGKEQGIKFIVHTNEQNHVIPHIHASYGEYNVEIEIESQRILAGNIPNKQIKIATQWVKENKENLLGKWKEISISAVSNMTVSNLSKGF